MRSRSRWANGFPGSKLRSRLSMTSWMLLSCLYLFMLRSRRDSLPLAVIFVSLLAVSQRSIDVWVGPGEVMDSLDHGVWRVALPVPVRDAESPSLQVLGASSLALWMLDFNSDQGSETET